jgi:hypothetical protein
MNLNLDFYNNLYSSTNYSSNVKSNSMPTASTISTEERKMNNTAATSATVTEIPVLSNEAYNRMFASNNYRNMNDKIIIVLQNNENKTFEYYNYIKLKRGLKEYEDFLKGQLEIKVNQKKETEKTMFAVKKYLDYVKSTNNGVASPYLGGFENKYKIDEVTIPDLIGITKKETQVLNENISFIFLLVNAFLKANKTKNLYTCIESLLTFIGGKIIILEPIFIKEEDYDKNDINIIQNINNLYFLLSSLLDNGKFNLSKFLGIVKSKSTNKVGGTSNSNILKKMIARSKNKSKSKNKNKKSSLSTNKKTDDIDKKVKYILSYYAILNPDINTKQYEDLKEKLRKTWWKEKFDLVLKDSLEKLGLDTNYTGIPKLLDSNGNVVNLTSSNLSQELQRGNINTIIKKLKVRNSSISKDDSTYLKGILKNMFDRSDYFLQIYNPQNSNNFLTLKDFYTSKKINTSETLKPDEYIDIIQKIYSTYEKHYQKYELQDLLPERSNVQEQKDQQRVGISILRGIGNYCNIARKFIENTLKRIYSNDVMVMVRERNRINKLQKEQQYKPQQPINKIKKMKKKLKKIKKIIKIIKKKKIKKKKRKKRIKPHKFL